MSIKKSLGVRQTAEQAEETVSLRSSLDSSAEANEEIIGIARQLAYGTFGGNCSFADEDIQVMAACAKWAINNGIPDEICPNIIPKAKAWQAGERASWRVWCQSRKDGGNDQGGISITRSEERRRRDTVRASIDKSA